MPANPSAPRPAEPAARHNDWRMLGLRYVLPVAIVLGGAIAMAFGSDIDLEGGAGIVSAGLAVFGMNWLYRASIEGDRAREQEEAARVYLDVHGHWPDEDAAARQQTCHVASPPAASGPQALAEMPPGGQQRSTGAQTRGFVGGRPSGYRGRARGEGG
jgi:hypothetical protein